MAVQFKFIVLAAVVLQCYLTCVNAVTIIFTDGPGNLQPNSTGFDDLTVNVGATITLACGVGRSNSDLSWKFNDQPITYDDTVFTPYTGKYGVEIGNSGGSTTYSLTITSLSPEDAGSYWCQDSSDGDKINVIVPGSIAVPIVGDNPQETEVDNTETALRLTSVVQLTSTSIQVDWVVNQDSTAITSFRLRVKTTAEPAFERNTYLSPSSRSAVVTDLKPNTEYDVSVQPILGTVYGQFSESAKITTHKEAQLGCNTVQSRRYDISDLGTPYLFRGWVDVQGQGTPNDYCRVVYNGGPQFLSCALAGSVEDHVYTSPNASVDWFDAGYTDTWYMKDKDGDGRDDYCRCVGVPPNTVVSCMKAGDVGFLRHDDFQIPGSAGCHYNKVNPFFGSP